MLELTEKELLGIVMDRFRKAQQTLTDANANIGSRLTQIRNEGKSDLRGLTQSYNYREMLKQIDAVQEAAGELQKVVKQVGDHLFFQSK